MDIKKGQSNQRNRYLKLSLRKQNVKVIQDTRDHNRSSDVMINIINESSNDDSFDRLRAEIPIRVQSTIISSPIIINDSSDNSNIILEHSKEPSRSGHASFNCTNETSPKESRPSIGGWSPAQNIICATPKNNFMPTTPQDTANESFEQCSIKKVQRSQHKLLNELYGETWKTIPALFKTISHKYENFNGITKKLFDDDRESDKENIRSDIKQYKELYLTGSDVKRNERNDVDAKKSKKKLYTERTPNVQDVPKVRNVNSTTKKYKGKSVTELVGLMNGDVDILTNKVKNITVTPSNDSVKRLSFVGSLIDNVPPWRCHVEAIQYHDDYKNLREKLARRLYEEFNKVVFDNVLDADLPILWDTKLRSTAGTTTNRLVKTANGERIRTSSVKLSTKVLDGPQRLRDTLIHELCHAATWLIDGVIRAGHGPLWKKWATKALRSFPELGEISRCHSMEIHYKYSYKCTKCGYSIKRHSKSIDVTKKGCGYCHGTFEVIINKKNKDGLVVSTPARKAGPNDFALFVKQNYGTLKDKTKSHADVMKILGEQFSAKKNNINKGS